MSDLPKMSTWGTQGQKYEICDKEAREQNAQLGKETENIRNEVEALKQMSATAEELPSGSAPTASYSNGVFHIGIPQGPKGIAGEAGITPNITVTASTGEPGTDVRVTQSGTVENPVLAFTIPRGNDGHAGANGVPGKDGQGVPTGGTVGQVLKKTGSGDYETGWSDSAVDSEKLGGVAAAQYALKNNVPAHNLLDNSDFTNPVNQRGETSYSGYSYGIDRWYGSALYQTVSIQNNYITVSATGTSYVGIRQKLENMAKLAGKTVTFATQIYSSVGTRIAFIDENGNSLAKVDGAAGQNQILTLTYTIPSNVTSDSVIPIIVSKTQAKGDSTNIYWAALYEGSYTADTLPAYQPKGYAAELAECQRYYIKYTSDSTIPMAVATKVSNTVCRATIMMATTMRTKYPTINTSGCNIIGVEITSIGSAGIVGNGILLTLNCDASSLAYNTTYCLAVNSGGYIEISADL